MNGGGALTLHFQRAPLQPRTTTVIVPWNEIVVIDPVIMEVDSSGSSKKDNGLWKFNKPCQIHSAVDMKPTVFSTWFPNMVGGYRGKRLVYTEAQVSTIFWTYFLKPKFKLSFQVKFFVAQKLLKIFITV